MWRKICASDEMKIIEIIENDLKIPIYSWTENIEEDGLGQAIDLTELPFIFHHVALMPDIHPGYGMPIGGVIACDGAVIPNAVGVDIGCGMVAVKTSLLTGCMNMREIRELLNEVKKLIPMGEGKAHKTDCEWNEFQHYQLEVSPPSNALQWYENIGWYSDHVWNLAKKNLGTLGGGKMIASRPFINFRTN